MKFKNIINSIKPQLMLVSCGLFFLGCHSSRLIGSIDPLCYMPCYGGPASSANKGICKSGTWSCDNDGKLTTCDGWIAPEADDICDGLDNDCDGFIDENNLVSCSNECGKGFSRCVLGAWSQCSARKPSQEICDGIDNDCDGIVDNSDKLPVEFCYTGPNNTMGNGDCHPGIYKCDEGAKYCANEKVPTKETCDGLDNDCNGKVDDGLNSNNNLFDVILVIDDSCSMSGTIQKIKTASTNFSLNYKNNPRFKFAVEDITDLPADGNVTLKQDLADATVANSYIQTVDTANGGGAEASYDAVYLTADLVNNPLNISWRSGSDKIIIMFTDEPGQSYLNPPLLQSDVVARLNGKNIKVYIFTALGYDYSFQDIAAVSNGGISRIEDQEYIIENKLNQIFALACK